MTKAIRGLTEKEVEQAHKEAVSVLITNHLAEFERIRQSIEFNARQEKADKKSGNE